MRQVLTAVAVAAVMACSALAQRGPVHKIGEEGVKAPVLIKEVKPKYTDSAKARQVQGTVEVSAVILTDGTVSDIRVTRTLDEELDQQAMDAVREWRFRPGTKDDKAVDVQVNIELTFTLRDKK